MASNLKTHCDPQSRLLSRWTMCATVIVFAFCFSLPGCDQGPVVYPVSGRVTVDGEPVEGAAVGMIPAVGGRHGAAVTDANGDFVVGTFTPSDGALAGEHKIVVTKVKMIKPGNERAGIAPEYEYVVPGRYDDPETSGLNVTVTKEMEPLKLELEQ